MLQAPWFPCESSFQQSHSATTALLQSRFPHALTWVDRHDHRVPEYNHQLRASAPPQKQTSVRFEESESDAEDLLQTSLQQQSLQGADFPEFGQQYAYGRGARPRAYNFA